MQNRLEQSNLILLKTIIQWKWYNLIHRGLRAEATNFLLWFLKLCAIAHMYYVSRARNGQDCSSHFPVAVTMSEFIETGMQQSYGCHHLASRGRSHSLGRGWGCVWRQQSDIQKTISYYILASPVVCCSTIAARDPRCCQAGYIGP